MVPLPTVNPDSGRFDVIPYTDLSPEATWWTLGRGSFGRVFKGQYLGLDVAIKEVLESDEYDVDKYFKRECTLMKECRHPNIVQFIGLCLAPAAPPDYLPSLQLWDEEHKQQKETDERERTSAIPIKPQRRRILIISEYLPSGNLRTHIANTKLDFGWRTRLSFSVDVARALAYLHARNCLHRDLKGENLLITDNYRIKVCDFGFARIAARNEEEMRRMSYCGTDGYMSPEILLGDEFGLETDIFSLGVLFCEIISRRLVEDNTFKREMPTFGLDAGEIHELASSGCPPAFIELAIACVSVDPSSRPRIRDVLGSLMQIEREVIESQAATEKAYNVGSLTFTAKNKRKDGKRPAPSGRIPSFEGKLAGPKYSDSETKDQGDISSDEDVDETLAKLAKLQIGNGKTGSGFYMNAKHAEATSQLADVGHASAVSTQPDTYSVIKGSKANGRTSTLFMDLNFADAPSGQTSSIITIKQNQPPSVNDIFATPGSLPSLPSSWLQTAKEPSVPNSITLNNGIIVGLPASGTRSTIGRQECDPPSEESLSDVDTPATTPNSEDGLPEIQAEKSLEKAVSVAVEDGTILPPANKFATIRALSLPVPIQTDTESSPVSSTGSNIFSPHRFTLIKPGWRALWESSSKSDKQKKRTTSDKAVPPVRKSSDGAGANTLATILPMQLLGAGLLTRCQVCDKRLGLLKPYLSCDDCHHVYHVRCGDLTSPTCGRHTDSTTAASTTTQDVKSKDKGKKIKRDSRRLSKSPRASLIAV